MALLDLVLVIDDDFDDTFFTSRALHESGQVKDVKVIHRATEAVQYLESLPLGIYKIPELVLLDLNMHLLDGWDVIAELTEMDNSLLDLDQIAIFTSSQNPNDRKRAKEAGVKMFYNKPLTKAVIQEMIDQVLGHE